MVFGENCRRATLAETSVKDGRRCSILIARSVYQVRRHKCREKCFVASVSNTKVQPSDGTAPPTSGNAP